MNEQEQRIAIAEHMGWKGPNHPDVCDFVRGWPSEDWIMNPAGHIGHLNGSPDYPNDLNACHEMEKTLDAWDMMSYLDLLIETGTPCTATAAQRCEAFLKTVGLWNGDL